MNENLFDVSVLESQQLKQEIPDILIYQHYCPELQIGVQKSPLRSDRKGMSFSLEWSKAGNGRVKWKDHARRNFGDVYEFVIEWYKAYHGKTYDLKEIRHVIHEDLKDFTKTIDGQLHFKNKAVTHNNTKGERKKKVVTVKDLGWTEWAFRYWAERYGITMPVLNMYYMGHAKEVWLKIGDDHPFLWGVSVPDNPIFYWYFPKTNHVKCYRPFARAGEMKWIMSATEEDIQGLYQLRLSTTRPDLLIITKAMKEVAFYRSLGVHSIAFQGEGYIPKPEFMEYLFRYCKKVISVLDNDRAGKHAAYMLRKDYGVQPFLIREQKNITDLWEYWPQRVIDYVKAFKYHYGDYK